MTELVAAVLTRPTFAIEEATAFLAQAWGIHGNLRPLPSERDRNFAVAVAGSDAFVLKVANLAEDPAFLEMQHAALALLAAAGVPCQRAIAAVTGESIV